jgi:N-carbamoyl-L-amino-acid hydrolase
MIFAQSDPPISHAAIEDSSERALGVAIDAYGRTVEQVLARPDETTSQGVG